MTDHDVLSEHIHALRSRAVVAGDGSATQERIVASLRARRRRKRHMLRGLVWAALMLPFGSTGYAMIYGMPTALRPLLVRIGLAAEPPVERAAPRKRSAAATPIVAVAPKVSAASVVSAPDVAIQAAEAAAPKRSTDASRSLRRRAAAAPSQEPVQVASSTESSDEALSRELYARAHQLHFVVRDREAALRAWDDYLARAPLQVLRIEAEYNRALCLVRLGRNQEALRELAPFADGRHGAYRQRESAALVRALSR